MLRGAAEQGVRLFLLERQLGYFFRFASDLVLVLAAPKMFENGHYNYKPVTSDLE